MTMPSEPQTWIVTAEIRTTDLTTATELRKTLDATLNGHGGTGIKGVRVELVLDEPGDGSFTDDVARAVVDELDRRRPLMEVRPGAAYGTTDGLNLEELNLGGAIRLASAPDGTAEQ